MLNIIIILSLGLLGSALFAYIKLPSLIGMLIAGIFIGPYGFNLLQEEFLTMSSDIRGFALIIILLRSGLGIEKKSLLSVGKTALWMSVIPAVLEGFTIAFLSIYFFGFTFIQGGMLGFILAAVSPAVIVPMMLKLKEQGVGMNKNIPVLILASASVDDVVAMTIFTSFLSLYTTKTVNIFKQLLSIPLSIALGVSFGLLLGLGFIYLMKKIKMDQLKQLIILLLMALFLVQSEAWLKNYVAVASLIGVMALGFIINDKLPKHSHHLSTALNAMWGVAQIFLFVLVGAEVNIDVALKAGGLGIILIFIGLIARSIGVYISTMTSKLNKKEQLFTILSFTPKATVQAAIGSIPLAMGVSGGELMLAIAVLSILITAPLGPLLIERLHPYLLRCDEAPQ